MTAEEYAFLKKWMAIHPKQQLASPFPASDLMHRLIASGFFKPVSRPDALNSKTDLVTGYEVTKAGEDAVKQYETDGLAP